MSPLVPSSTLSLVWKVHIVVTFLNQVLENIFVYLNFEMASHSVAGLRLVIPLPLAF